ncbi:MAG: FtsW/RodA/SpoVE family cell cycle protein, partial [Candidatus Eremiobacteraeota bacterium]|nr:FtsW/RodA/SpoVE family cell cycle protein [Candidatus Eremiobacteraeota bacterium]
MDRPWYRSFEWSLAGACLAITLLGLLCIGSATLHDGAGAAAGEVKKQALYAGLGLALMAGCAALDYHRWQRWALPLYVVTVVLLAFILFKGNGAHGAVRWIALGPFQFQPSEPAKLVLAIGLAAMLARGPFARIQDLWLPLLAAGVPALLILKQPDLGTALIILSILSTQLYFGVANLLDFMIYAIAGAVAATFVVTS